MSKAANELLEKLHAALAEDMRKKLEAGECDASTLNAIRQFLKDNGISGVMTKDPQDPLRNIADEVRKLNLPSDDPSLH